MQNNDISPLKQGVDEKERKAVFFRNFGWLTAGKAGYLLLSFLVTLTVVRYLGPYDFGTINYVDAYVKFAYVIGTFGLDAIIVKEVATGKKDSNIVVWTASLIRLLLGTLLGIGVTLFLYLTDGNNPLILTISVLESVYLVFVAFHGFFDYFQAKMHSKWNALAEMTAYIGTSLFRIVLLICKADVKWFAFANSLDMIIIVIFLGVIYFRENGFHPAFDRAEAKKLMSQSWYYMIAALLAVVFTQIDRIMIEKLLGRNDVGEYSVTTNFASIWGLAASILTQIAIPVIHRSFSGEKKNYFRRIRQSYAATLWLNIAFATMVSIFAQWIVRLFYGEAYIGITGTLRIVVWYYGLSTVSLITQAHLSNIKKSIYVVWTCVIGIILDISLNMALIPVLGIEGAAVSTLITQIVIQIIIPLVIPAMRECGKELVKGLFLWDILNRDEQISIRYAIENLKDKIFGSENSLQFRREVYRERFKRLGQILYYPYVLGIFALYSVGIGSDDPLFLLVFMIGLVCLALKILVLDEFSSRELFILCILAVLLVLNTLHNGDRVLLLGFIAIAGAKNVDLKKLFKAGIILRISLMFLTIMHALLFGIGTADTFAYKSYSTIINVTRKGVSALGYVHSNTAYLVGFSAAVLCVIVYWDKLRLRHYLLLTAAMTLLFYMFVCRAGFLCWLLLMLLIAVYKAMQRGLSRAHYLKLLCIVPVAAFAVSMWLSYYATTPDRLPLGLGNLIQGTFFERFKLAQPAISRLLYEPFGTGLGVADEWKDIAYVHIFHNNGWILGIIFMAVFIRTMWSLAERRKAAEVLILAVWAVYFIAEHPAVSVGHNLVMLYMAQELYRTDIKGVNRVKTLSVSVLLREMRRHIVLALVVTLLVGAAGAAVGYKGIGSGELSAEDQTKIANWETSIANYKNNISSYEEQLGIAENELKVQREYIDNSIYMRLNSQSFYSANVQIALTGDANIGGALAGYHAFVTEGDFRNLVAQTAGIEDEGRLKEVSSGYIYSNMYIVNILYDTADGAEVLRQAAEKVLVGQAEKLVPDYGAFTVQVNSSSVQLRSESGVLDGQNGKLNSLRSYEETVRNLSAALENNKTGLSNLENTGSGVTVKSGGSKKKAVVFGAIGLVAGFALSAVIAAFLILTGDRIHGTKDIRELGVLPLDEGEDNEYAVNSLKLQARKENVSSLSLIVLKNEKDKLTADQNAAIEKLSDQIGKDISHVIDLSVRSCENLETIANSGAAVFAAIQGKSRGRELCDAKELCERYHIPVWGSIIVKG